MITAIIMIIDTNPITIIFAMPDFEDEKYILLLL
jgi:hypothetical protein